MSEEVIDNVLAPVESLVGMIPGCSTPIGRALIFGSLGTGYAFAVKPAVSFTADGVAKPFILFAPDDEQASVFPYWAWGVLPAVIFGIFL
jgi:hypothetical protein